MTPDEERQERMRHVAHGSGLYCACGRSWPCWIAELLRESHQQRARADAAVAALERITRAAERVDDATYSLSIHEHFPGTLAVLAELAKAIQQARAILAAEGSAEQQGEAVE